MLNHAVNALLKYASPRHVGPMNPSFPLTLAEADAHLAAMTRHRRPLVRPAIVLGGFMDYGIGPHGFARRLRRLVDGPVVGMSFAHCLSFDACRRRVVRTLDRRFGPGDRDGETIAVDVVGQSMGGLIALVAGLERAGERRLQIDRLFTVSSPLRGANLAMLTRRNLWPMQADMRPDSKLYRRLAAAPPAHEVLSYARLGDRTVGVRHASLEGGKLWWLDNPRPGMPHAGALGDARVLVDVARRLRGEPPVTTEPPAPLPDRS